MKTNKVHTGDLVVTKDTEVDFEEITGISKLKTELNLSRRS